MEFYSPLRYPGGKGKVADYFKEIFKENFLYDSVYIEPYAGGASVGLSLLFNEYASKIIINDIDKSIYSFWYSVLNKTDALCKLIRDTPLNLDTWQTQKQIQKYKEKNSYIAVGFSTFFLNRTNRSGILGAGIIGGRDQSGKWLMNARFNKGNLINRIEKIALYKSRIELHQCDAVQLVKQLKSTLPGKAIFYFDPPYYVKGKDLYLNHYKPEDHKEIADEVIALKDQKWIVTYDNVPQIKHLYNSHRVIQYSLNYSAGKSSKGEELMVFSDNLYISKHKILGNTS